MTDYQPLAGVIAAVPTPFDRFLDPDCRRFVGLCERLLASGCDGLNICGTTGEATSMSVDQRRSVMVAAASTLPLDRLMVGTGAASLADAVELTRVAGQLGYAGALLLPPFYYKQVSNGGIAEYIDVILESTRDNPIPVYLYNFPALSGLQFTHELIGDLVRRHGSRIRGVKDSSGDQTYSRTLATEFRSLSVFPSDEATLLEARAGAYAGCISGTANLNSELCAAAFHRGDRGALDLANQVRALCAGSALIPKVKALLASAVGDMEYARVLPPLRPIDEKDAEGLAADYQSILSSAGLLSDART
jgi:4-hydroxy-tetrahydrodipicolinate synthase